MTSAEVLNREFLEMRAKVLELAASLDRLDRAEGVDSNGSQGASDPRLQRLRDGLKILLSNSSERAEQVQLLFSREYDDGWRKRFGV
jgi:hypothetical protein